MSIRAALIFHIHASADVADLGGFDDFEGLDNIGDDVLSLLQLRAHAADAVEDCVLVQGDAVSDSFAPAYEALSDTVWASDTWTQPGGTGTPVQSLEECYNRVKSMNDLSIRRGQPPVCTGLSLPTGNRGQCYCQRAITATDENPAWQSCKFGGFSEADLFPGRDKLAAEALGCFFTEKRVGIAAREVKIASAVRSKPECINLAKEQCPDANGINMDLRTPEMFQRFGSGCWCMYEQTGQREGGAYQNCELGVEPEEVVIDGVGFDGSCDWYPGDTNGAEIRTPKATSPAHCAQMVRQQCPDANAASLRISGSGDCFCETGATNSRAPGGNGVGGARTTWQSCILPPATTTPEPVADTEDDASAVGDPHMVSPTNHHSDICCHQGVCKACHS